MDEDMASQVREMVVEQVTKCMTPVAKEIKKIKATVHEHSNAIEQHKHCIASLEMIQCDKAVMVKGIPMVSRPRETTEQTHQALEVLWQVMELSPQTDIDLDSVARLGSVRPDGDPNYIPHIRITFSTPADKTEFNKRVHKLSKFKESKAWSCVTELPKVIGSETALARCVAYYIRKKWPGTKTTIRYQARAAKVSFKEGTAKAWTQCTDQQFKDYLAAFKAAGGYGSAAGGKGTGSRPGAGQQGSANHVPLGETKVGSQSGSLGASNTQASSSQQQGVNFEIPAFQRSQSSRSSSRTREANRAKEEEKPDQEEKKEKKKSSKK